MKTATSKSFILIQHHVFIFQGVLIPLLSSKPNWWTMFRIDSEMEGLEQVFPNGSEP